MHKVSFHNWWDSGDEKKQSYHTTKYEAGGVEESKRGSFFRDARVKSRSRVSVTRGIEHLLCRLLFNP